MDNANISRGTRSKEKSSLFSKINKFRLILVNIFFFGSIFLFGFILLIFVLIGSSAVSTSSGASVPSGEKSLLINPTGSLFEDGWWSDTSSFDPNQFSNSYYFDLTESIRYAIDDNSVKSIILNLSGFMGGSYPQLKEISNLLKVYQESDRPVYAWSESWTQSSYYLASVADEIKMGKMGDIILPGLSMKSFFYGDFLEKYKIDVEVFRAGDFKSAVEPYMGNSFSESSMKNLKRWSSDLWNLYLKDIAQNRSIDIEDLKYYSNSFDKVLMANHYSATDSAVAAGLIDEVVEYQNEFGFDAAYPSLIGEEVSYLDYLSSMQNEHGKKIGVLICEGSITSGYPQSPGSTGANRFIEQAEALFADQSVKAVVLRINSPGGSAFASEQMRIAVRKAAQESGKPVVVSMGGMAASGGYWLAMAGDEIFVDKGTITGSIGVFSMFPTFEKILTETLSIHIDGVSTSDFGTVSSWSQLTPSQRLYFQSSVNGVYSDFVSLVSRSRNMKREDVLNNGGGRVFTGAYALANELADTEGGFYAAVARAAELADVEFDSVDFGKRDKSIMEKMMEEVLQNVMPFSASASQTKINNIAEKIFKNNPFLDDLTLLNDPSGCYAWLPIYLSDPTEEAFSAQVGSSLQ